MSDPESTTREQWLVARLELLEREKELTRLRDEVNAARRRLPMVEITKDYSFEGAQGKVGLVDLFDGRRQLLIYHAMFEPDADAACPACTFWLDNLGHLNHFYARDTSFAASRSGTATRITIGSSGKIRTGRTGAARRWG